MCAYLIMNEMSAALEKYKIQWNNKKTKHLL